VLCSAVVLRTSTRASTCTSWLRATGSSSSSTSAVPGFSCNATSSTGSISTGTGQYLYYQGSLVLLLVLVLVVLLPLLPANQPSISPAIGTVLVLVLVLRSTGTSTVLK
jgi:hypothetical protein